MRSILPSPLKIRVTEYDRMANAGVFDDDRPRFELLRGQLYEMAPIGTPHLVAVTRLQHLFEGALADGPRVLVQQALIVDQFDEPEPDVVILREPLGRRKPRATDCLLVIEVAGTSYARDRTVKLPAYLRAGVPQVWIVNLGERSIEVYQPHTPDGTRYAPGAHTPAVAGISIDVAALLDDLPEDDA